MLCMLCHAMLCYAMPCYAMLCHAMLEHLGVRRAVGDGASGRAKLELRQTVELKRARALVSTRRASACMRTPPRTLAPARTRVFSASRLLD